MSSRVATVALMVAAAVTGCDSGERSPAERVSATEQRALPTRQLMLGGDLCPAKWELRRYPGETRQRRAAARRQLVALEKAYRKHPEAVVHTTYASSDEGPGAEDVTVRELAHLQLEGVTEPGIDTGPCPKRAARRLRSLLAR
jgi:hypothetical protein